MFLPASVYSQTPETKTVTVAWDYVISGSINEVCQLNYDCLTGFAIYTGPTSRGESNTVPPAGYESSIDLDCIVTRDTVDLEKITSVSCSFCGAPGSGSNVAEFPNSSACSQVVGNLVEGQTYYLSASAYSKNSMGEKIAESLYSNEISYTVPATKFTITSSVVAGSGSITPLGAVEYDKGSTATYTVTPAAGYKVGEVKVDGVTQPVGATYQIANIQANHTITASFVLQTFTINASAGAGGSINPSGTTTVNWNESKTYNIAASTGYDILDVKVDGSSIGAATSYTFSNVNANHTIVASFDIKRYTIVATASTGGNISPSGNVSVAYGSTQTFTITPSSGYRVGNVTVDGSSVGSLSGYTFNNVTSPHTISVSFIRQFIIYASAEAGGIINPSGTIYVDEGGSRTFTITPDSGYQISEVTVDGIPTGIRTSYTFANVITDGHSIQASFSLIPVNYTITLTVNNAGGKIDGPTTVSSGSDATYIFTVYEGYKCQSIKLDGVNIGCMTSYELQNVKKDHRIEFRLSPPKPKNLRQR
jgi:hypothetical protein